MFAKYRSILFSLFLVSHLYAQKTETFYNYNWKSCPAEKATYYSVTTKTDSGYYRLNYFAYAAKLQMAALFEDSACKIHNGNASWFYSNGKPEHICRFVHNIIEGVDLKYHFNGTVADSATYHNGWPEGTVFSWHNNGMMADSIAPIGDSSYVHVSWFDDGTPSAAGRERIGKKYGTWIFYRRDGSKAALETYERGKLVTAKNFSETNLETTADTIKLKKQPELIGSNSWSKYLAKNLYWPNQYHLKEAGSVVLQAEFIITEEGNITDVAIIVPFHPDFDKIAYDVIRKGPKWQPAIEHNRPVKYRFRQAITFSQDN